MPTGICKMCLRARELLRSHLYPAALYDYCRTSDLRPIKVGDGAVYSTDRQIQDHLLCAECEDILSASGETWVNPKLATWERTFPLYDLLTKSPTDTDDGVSIYYAGRNPDFKVEKLIHLGIGIFWKASAHSWGGTSKENLIELGPYSDAIRRWLRQETGFPQDICLQIVLATPPAAQIALMGPYEVARDEARHFLLNVPGVLFFLDVGKKIGNDQRLWSICHHPDKPIMVWDEMQLRFATAQARNLQQFRKTRSYLRAMEKIRATRTLPKPRKP